MSRETALLSLLNLDSPLDVIKDALSCYTWDSDKEYVVVSSEILIHALNKLLIKEISSQLLEEWANMIECRDDIGFENEQLLEVIVELANPSLYGIITESRVEDIIITLSTKSNI